MTQRITRLMTHGIRDSSGQYLLTDPALSTATPTTAELRFDRGTLLLEGAIPPPALNALFRYDPRVAAFRAPAHCYYQLRALLRDATILNPSIRNHIPRYQRLNVQCALGVALYPHQQEALTAWQQAQSRGIVVLPTGAGKTLVGVLAIAHHQRDTLIVVPTLDLMHQWYALLRVAFPNQDIGLIGGGYHEVWSLAVATYDSAARHCDRIGNRYGLLICDEVHHLPAEFYRSIAESLIAPYRLGLTATFERGDGLHTVLSDLMGPVVYQRHPAELAGSVLATFQIRPLLVELTAAERLEYQQALAVRDEFLRSQRIGLGSLVGWQRFVMCSARSSEGRRAMQAHQTARRLAQANPAKIRALNTLLIRHATDLKLIFTDDNATAYEIAERFLIPAITHQTPIKERQAILEAFRWHQYRAIVTSRVLNEGVDMPEASVGIVFSGTASQREFIQRLGRILRRGENKTAILYEFVTRQTREEQVAKRRRQSSPEALNTATVPAATAQQNALFEEGNWIENSWPESVAQKDK